MDTKAGSRNIGIHWALRGLGQRQEAATSGGLKLFNNPPVPLAENLQRRLVAQIALELEPVPATIAKLTRQRLDRHEALHAIGAVLSDDIVDLLKGNEESWPQQRYRRRLEKLTAKR